MPYWTMPARIVLVEASASEKQRVFFNPKHGIDYNVTSYIRYRNGKYLSLSCLVNILHRYQVR